MKVLYVDDNDGTLERCYVTSRYEVRAVGDLNVSPADSSTSTTKR
jgi:hypothetical protein